MPSTTFRHPLALLAILAALAATGCTSSTRQSSTIAASGTAPVAVSAPAGLPLAVGMNSAQVEQVAGSPDEVQTTEINGAPAEIWVYTRSGNPVLREVTTGTREVPYVDPISGRDLVRQEPIIGYATVTPSIEVRLVLFRGALISWSEIAREPHVIFN